MGQRDIHRLLIIGAMAVVRSALRKEPPEGSWLQRMLARKPKMLVGHAGKGGRFPSSYGCGDLSDDQTPWIRKRQAREEVDERYGQMIGQIRVWRRK